jgi:hypothetical protein
MYAIQNVTVLDTDKGIAVPAQTVIVDDQIEVVFKIDTEININKAGNYPQKEYISPIVFDIWKSQWASQEDIPGFIWQNWALMVKGLNEAGVPLMVGTDLLLRGILPGFSIHEEMAIWQEAGIPPTDILRSAMLVPIQFMGLQDRLGSSEEGKMASMILVRGNPLEDIQNAQQIEGVFLRGEYFRHQKLDQLLNEARDLAQSSNP